MARPHRHPNRQRRARLAIALLLALALLPAGLRPAPVAADTCTVNTLLDDAGRFGSLRATLARGICTTIQFSVTGTMTIRDTLLIDRTVTINGPGADKLTLSGVGLGVDLLQLTAGTVTISGLTFIGPVANNAIYQQQGALTLDRIVTDGGRNGVVVSGGTLAMTASIAQGASRVGVLVSDESGGKPSATITTSTLSENQFGLRIIGDASALLLSSTISGNRTTGPGAGLLSGGVATVRNSTITNNVADTDDTGDRGGGIATEAGGTIYLGNTIVAGNRRGGGGVADDCRGPLIYSLGYNLGGSNCIFSDEGDLNLPGAPATVLSPILANNGGPTRTHTLVAGGPAIDKIPAAKCRAATDQRGVQRPQGTMCDIGAVEYTAAPPSASPSPAASPSISPSPTPAPSPGSPPPSFADVPADYWAHGQIVAFARRGITTGCDTDPAGTRYYCPERPVTRAEMAAFLIRTLTGTTAAPAGPATPTFADVPTTHPQYGYIEALVARGITTGCGGGEYCPDREVTRAEMAAFIIRAKTSQTAAPAGPATPTFADVPADHPQYGFIEEMAARRITTGCGDPTLQPRTFCPGDNVTRAEMAVFVIRAYP